MRWTGLALCLVFIGQPGCTKDRDDPWAVRMKPTPPIEFSYDVPPDTGVGTPVDVKVTFTVRAPASRADLRFHAGRGLLLDSPDPIFEYGPMERGGSHTETIRVTPEAEGTVSLHAYAAGTFDGKRLTRAISIPVGSGPPILAPSPGTLKADPATGRKIIEMPAQLKNE